MFNCYKLSCGKMIRQADDTKTILCEDNGEVCICTSCIDKSEGYIVNSWVKECPRYIPENHKTRSSNRYIN